MIEERDYEMERLDPYGENNEDVSINKTLGVELENRKAGKSDGGLLKQFQQMAKKK